MNTDVFLRVSSETLGGSRNKPLISADRTLMRQAEASAGTKADFILKSDGGFLKRRLLTGEAMFSLEMRITIKRLPP